MAHAQHAGQIMGTVIDAATSHGVAGVAIRLPALQRTAVTDAAGHFALRGIEPGEWTLHVERLGFVARTSIVTIRNGWTLRVAIHISPAPVALDGVRVEAARSAGTHLDRAALERSGARTAGDALRGVAGVVVRSTGPGSPQTVSLRGMAPDAVLVLVDGVPLNDAVTGEADLSLIDASSIDAITVLPGAQSARWGPRAAAGVIRIDTRRSGGTRRRAEFGVGSLRALDGALAWGGGSRLLWTTGLVLRRLDGAHTYALPAELGGAARRRENADLSSIDVHAAGSVDIMGGQLDARAGHDALERGLPGRGFAPSRHARQESDRSRASLHWKRACAQCTLALLLAGSRHRYTHADSAPPLGLPYADTTDMTHVEARIDAERMIAGESVVGAGVELRHQYIGGTVLDSAAPHGQLDVGIFTHGAVALSRPGGASLGLAAHLRIDCDPVDDDVVASHSVTLSWARSDVAFHMAHRSGYSPPTPGDRFFRDAVGIAPNPDLRAERVPAELEIGANASAHLGGWVLGARAAAYRGDIDGMIVWAPDFRFVWSPYNQDAKRTGADVSVELLAPRGIARVRGSWSFVRVTYDHNGDDDDVQVAYRPRHAGGIDGALVLGATRLNTSLRYTGSRTTAPTTLNTLAAFWTLDAAVAHTRSFGGWSVGLDLRVDRVFDDDDSLIFGFPEPGRTIRFGVRVTPNPTPTRLSIGSSQ
jgi:outer membrane cobalamin receptor